MPVAKRSAKLFASPPLHSWGADLRIPSHWFYMVIVLFFGFGVSRAEEPSAILARVNDVPITLQEVENETSRIIARTFYHGDVPSEKREAIRKEAIESLIGKELVYQEGMRQGIEVDSEDIEVRLEKLKKKYASEKEFKEALKNNNLSVRKLQGRIEREIVIEKVFRTEVEGKTKTDDAEIMSYYEKHRDKYKEPEQIKLRHIALMFDPAKGSEDKEKARARAAEILKRVRAGEDFRTLASEYSEDEYKEKAGDLGYVERGRMEPELEKTIFSLTIGDTTGPVETEYGFYLIKVEGRKPESLSPFDEVKEGIKKELGNSKKEERKAEWIKSLRDKAKIEYR